jgi:two-component system LytT family response regulator
MENQLYISIGGRISLNPENIILFEGQENYSKVYLRNGKTLIVATTLKKLESRFKNSNFYRSHKKYLVNIIDIKNLEENKANLANNKQILISRRKKEGLVSLMLKTENNTDKEILL